MIGWTSTPRKYRCCSLSASGSSNQHNSLSHASERMKSVSSSRKRKYICDRLDLSLRGVLSIVTVLLLVASHPASSFTRGQINSFQHSNKIASGTASAGAQPLRTYTNIACHVSRFGERRRNSSNTRILSSDNRGLPLFVQKPGQLNEVRNAWGKKKMQGSYRPYLLGMKTHDMLPLHSTTERDTESDILLSSSSYTMNEGGVGGSDDGDASEWQAITDAFQMYKAAYGDLKVPARFVVPSMPPWPKNAWEMKLGHKVAAIRSTGKHVQDSPERRTALEDMGFVWRLRAPSARSTDSKLDGISFEQVYSALETYKSIHDDLNVQNSFVVPDVEPWPEHTRGMPLGKKLSTIRSKPYLKSNPGAEDKLTYLGLQMDGKTAVNDVRYQKVYNALAKYKEINGDLLVPQPFVVPEGDDNWPEEMWSLRLGARVNAIRSQGTFVNAVPERKDELDVLGFVWDYPVNEKGKKRGRKKKEATAELLDGSPFQLDNDTMGQSAMGQPANSMTPPAGPGGMPDWTSSPDAWREQRRIDLLGQYGQEGAIPSQEALDSSRPVEDIKREPDPNTMEERSLAIGLESGIISGVE
jgi:hypothetical protein